MFRFSSFLLSILITISLLIVIYQVRFNDIIIKEYSSDDISLNRVINVPKRGIGNVTIANINKKAEENNISIKSWTRIFIRMRWRAGMSTEFDIIGTI